MVEHEYAINELGEPVYIENAVPSIRSLYFCPECHAEMVVKNQGQIKEHHFAHYNGDGGAGGIGGPGGTGEGESPAHYDTILFFLEQFRKMVRNGEPFIMSRVCSNHNNLEVPSYNILNYGLNFKKVGPYYVPNYRFNYDILKDVDCIEREYTIPGSLWRPDLALLCKGKVIRVIEVFYTNEDDPAKTEFYKVNKIDVLKIDLKKNPNAFSEIKNNWEFGKIKHSTIYCYSGCNVLTSKDWILENHRVMELARNLSVILSGLHDDLYEVHNHESMLASLHIDYRNLNTDIQTELEKTWDYINFAKSDLQKKIDGFDNDVRSLSDDYLKLELDYTHLINDAHACYSSLDQVIKDGEESVNKIKHSYEETINEYASLLQDIKKYKQGLKRQGTTLLYSIDASYINTPLLSRIRRLSREGLREIVEGNNGMLDVYEI